MILPKTDHPLSRVTRDGAIVMALDERAAWSNVESIPTPIDIPKFNSKFVHLSMKMLIEDRKPERQTAVAK